MDAAPRVLPSWFVEVMQEEARKYLAAVMQVVNQAPQGDWIAGSEEQVRELSAQFRQQTFQRAVQERIDAAEAAFSPSVGPSDAQAAGE